MVVVSILGGMGNQLHAYSAAYTVAKYINQPLVLDVSDYYGGYLHPYVLDLLQIPNHLKLYYPYSKAIFSGPYAAPVQFLSIFECFINTNELHSREELLAAVKGKENVWIMGYGGISFCTDEEREELRRLFWPLKESNFLTKFIHDTERKGSVAVHVRRTDFVDVKAVSDDILKYYQAAISYMEQHVKNPEFYFFSDDIEWVKKHLGTNENYHYIHCLGGRATDMEEIFCMASCKHRILTNTSTFGAWASILSQREGMNIINMDMPEIPRSFLMDSVMIEQYCCLYKADYTEAEESIPWDSLENKVYENRNDEVLDYIDRISADVYGLTPEMKSRLMELKGIAHIQKNDVEMASSVFDCIQQVQRDSFAFSYNYAVVLGHAGHRTESLLYMGNALRMDKSLDIGCFLKIEEAWEKEILTLVSGQKKRHYIFLDARFQKNVKTYYNSIAIMLRNMGNKVTALELEEVWTVQKTDSLDKDIILQKALDIGKKQDSVYDWDIMEYFAWELETAQGETVWGLKDFLPHITAEEDDIIYIAHSIKGIQIAKGGHPLIFLDVLSEWDVWKEEVNLYKTDEWEEIYCHADKIITRKEMPEEYRKKKTQPFGHGKQIETNEVRFLEERISELNHYMRNDESLFGMLSVLKAVEELKSR